MSKIQEALDKIKLAQEKAQSEQESSSAQSNKNSFDVVSGNATNYSDGGDITDMHEPRLLTDDEKAKTKIIGARMHDRRVFNAFRDLRTSVFQRIDKDNPIVMVTSCTNSGGSSFVSMNLAAAIANDETKTSLLVDCNLAAPSFSNLPITDSPKVGLKDYLKETNRSIDEIIYPCGVPRLRVIPAGNLNAPMAEYFTSMRLTKLFSEIQSRYRHRYIIVDAPPITENADARILAQVCDYVVLVIPYGKITEDQVLRTARIIGKDKLLGTVFNNQPRFPRLSWL